jgi:hypothetical protein
MVRVTIGKLKTVIHDVLTEAKKTSVERAVRLAEKLSAKTIDDEEKLANLPPKQLVAANADHEAAKQAWEEVFELVATPTEEQASDLEVRAKEMIDKHEDLLWAIDADVERAKEQIEQDAKEAKVLKSKGLKPITVNDLKNVYVGAKSSYGSSYAMLIDDAISGAERPANKLGIRVLVDWGWFPLMFRYIKGYFSWDKIPNDVKEDMVRYANEELVKWGKKPAKKKSLKKPGKTLSRGR